MSGSCNKASWGSGLGMKHIAIVLGYSLAGCRITFQKAMSFVSSHSKYHTITLQPSLFMHTLKIR